MACLTPFCSFSPKASLLVSETTSHIKGIKGMKRERAGKSRFLPRTMMNHDDGTRDLFSKDVLSRCRFSFFLFFVPCSEKGKTEAFMPFMSHRESRRESPNDCFLSCLSCRSLLHLSGKWLEQIILWTRKRMLSHVGQEKWSDEAQE